MIFGRIFIPKEFNLDLLIEILKDGHNTV